MRLSTLSYVFFWVVTPVYLYVGTKVSEERTVSIVKAEDWARIFLRSVCVYLQVHIVLNPQD
jgi:hypothetical protein